MWLSGVFGCHVPVGTPCNVWTVPCWDDRWSKGSSLGPGLGYVQHVLPQPSHVLCVNLIPWKGFDSELVTPSHLHELCFWTFVDTGLACLRSFWRALAVLFLFLQVHQLLGCCTYMTCFIYLPVSCVFYIVDALLEDTGSLLAITYMNVPSWRSCDSAKLLLPCSYHLTALKKKKINIEYGKEVVLWWVIVKSVPISMKKPFCQYFLLVLTEHIMIYWSANLSHTREPSKAPKSYFM